MTTTSNLLPTGLPRIDLLEMRGIVKRFPGVVACDHVDFDIKAGEVHQLHCYGRWRAANHFCEANDFWISFVQLAKR